VSYQVNGEIQALDLTAGYLSDDPAGVAALRESVSHPADEPRPPESFPYGSPDLRRLRAGRYRVFHTIDEQRQAAEIDHVARLHNRAAQPPGTQTPADPVAIPGHAAPQVPR
jgi:mRNA interferase RelE/StbE